MSKIIKNGIEYGGSIDSCLVDYFATMRPNLLSGTQNWTGSYTSSSSWTSDGTYTDEWGNVLTVKKRTGAWGGLTQSITLSPGIYTYSEYLKSDDNAATAAEVAMFVSGSNSKYQGFYDIDYLYGLRKYGVATPYNGFCRHHYTFIVIQQSSFAIRCECMTDGHTLYIAGRKLEKGFYPTPWCA